MKKDTLTLAVLVSLLLVVNALFMVMIQFSKSQHSVGDVTTHQGQIISNIVDGIRKQEPLQIFSKDVLTTYKPAQEPSEEEIIPEPASLRTETLTTPKGEKIILNYDKQTVTYKGREIPAIVDNFGSEVEETTTKEAQAWETISYPRFDVNIEESYYNNNFPEILNFLDNFSERFDLLENQTGWSSEQFVGTKLQMNITEKTTAGCWSGNSYPGRTIIQLKDLNFGCEIWTLQEGMLHESLHSINPLPLFFRPWLTEGFSEYNMYNILVLSEDITQETADNQIFNGYPTWNWPDYITNDYKDDLDLEIQNSQGYDITAWMFTMIRENYSMDFSDLYALINENYETLEKADGLGEFFQVVSTSGPSYVYRSDYTDTAVMQLFGRAAGKSFAQTKQIWEYDNANGPGWGVRDWVGIDWYADLFPTITISNEFVDPLTPVMITATINNTGDIDATHVSVHIYDNDNLIHSTFVDILWGSSTIVQKELTPTQGTHTIRVVVDEENSELESNDYNNEETKALYAYPPTPVVLQPFETVHFGEYNTVKIYPDAFDFNGDEITYAINDTRFTWNANEKYFSWKPGPTDAGDYWFMVNVNDTDGTDSEPVHIAISDRCTSFDKQNNCWVGCTCPLDETASAEITTTK